MASVFAIKISIYIVCVNLHSMIKLMLTFVNSGLLKTMIIMMLKIMPKHPKVGTNTPLTTRSNIAMLGSVMGPVIQPNGRLEFEDGILFSILFSVSAYRPVLKLTPS